MVRFAGIYGPISVAIYALCIFSLGILAYGVFTTEELAPFIANPDGLVPFLATSLLPSGFDGIVLLAAISAAAGRKGFCQTAAGKIAPAAFDFEFF